MCSAAVTRARSNAITRPYNTDNEHSCNLREWTLSDSLKGIDDYIWGIVRKLDA